MLLLSWGGRRAPVVDGVIAVQAILVVVDVVVVAVPSMVAPW